MAVAPAGKPPAASPSSGEPPRIPLDLFPATEQRAVLVSVLVLLQAWKIADLLASSPTAPSISLEPQQIAQYVNPLLLKWIAIDLVFVQVVKMLRVPRLNFGWKALLLVRCSLALVDWLMFGRWAFSAAFLVPTVIKSMLVTYPSTEERSMRVSKVLGDEKSHLGGQYTVHILAVSTAQLNPISTCYCLPVMAKPEPILVPLVLNNTVPSKLTYTITDFLDSTSKQTFAVPASTLIRQSHRHSGHADDSHLSPEDEGLPSWALVPASPAAKPPRHRVPHQSGSSPSSGRDDPLDLSPTESLYYLPVAQTGLIQLESVLDSDGIPVRIRRKRAADGVNGWETTRIVQCPRAGFERRLDRAAETHRCVSGVRPESWSLELAVAGLEPLALKWSSSVDGGRKKFDGLEGIVVGPKSDVAPTESGIIRVPMNVSLDKPGRTQFQLESVVDGCGNTVSFATDSDNASPSPSDSRQLVLGALKHKKARASPLLPGMLDSRSVVVHRPPEVAFVGACGRGEDVKLLKNGKSKLDLRISGIEQELKTSGHAAQWKVKTRFTPEDGGKVKESEHASKGALLNVEASEPGTYEIVDISSNWCSGIVLVPNTCNVVLQPEPTLLTYFEPMLDVCKSEVGLVSTLHLTGTPPFTVNYELADLTNPSRRPRREQRRISSLREEIRLEPGPGEWEYKFVGIGDKNYPNVVLPVKEAQYARRQKVALVGDAQWRDARHKKIVHACEGDTVTVELELKGTAPWEVEYAVLGQPKQTISDIKASPHKIEVAIPKHISLRGGEFRLSLESVKDGNGCRRPLTNAADLVVEVQRTRPSARFHGVEGSRSVVVREKERAKIPLRLTGNPPWTVQYQPPPLPSRPNDPVPPQEFVAESANLDIALSNPRPGVYRLLSVRDEFCPGDVTETDWTVAIEPRPKLRVDEQAGRRARNGSIIRPPVCEDATDSLSITFEGRAPFKAVYSLHKSGHHDKSTHSLASIQPHADMTLYTGPGHHVYNIIGVGDTLYTEPDAAGLVSPADGRSGPIRIEQDVYPLPTAKFLHGPKHGFCVSDKLSSRSTDDLVVRLEGQPPFKLELEVREEGHRTPKRYTVDDIKTHDWPLSLPVELKTPLPHTISLRRVVDSHGCQRVIDASTADLISAARSVTVPVAEIASITPVLPAVDACVGDFLEYVVQGAPPFTVKYAFNGKEHVVPLQSSKFQRLAAEPGEFRIVSVGHGQDQCRANDVNLIKHVHPIPTASVDTGDSVVVDIREGDQTEIVFKFTGTPPFTFTYSRRRPQDRYKDKKVLETHTVTDIKEHSYSIFTSVEGSWSVSYIADAHCSYPPARQVDGGALVKS